MRELRGAPTVKELRGAPTTDVPVGVEKLVGALQSYADAMRQGLEEIAQQLGGITIEVPPAQVVVQAAAAPHVEVASPEVIVQPDIHVQSPEVHVEVPPTVPVVHVNPTLELKRPPIVVKNADGEVMRTYEEGEES